MDAATAAQGIPILQATLQVLAALHLTAFKYPEQSTDFDKRTYDYIIVGGGTAGCVLASRLVEDKNTSVLLIEAGTDPRLESEIPGILLFLKSSEASWNFTDQDLGLSQWAHKPIKDHIPLGRALGGSSTLNFLLYSSGSKHDYDDWAKLVNDSIWSSENVLPYLKKSQRLEVPYILEADAEFFGQEGNVGLTVAEKGPILSTTPYFKMFNEIGHNIIPSVNVNNSIGYTKAIYTISNGMRQHTAYTYLTPKKDFKNLHVLKNTLVTRILFDSDKNAIGVTVVTSDEAYVTIKSRKEVILSAGIVNSPKLLMLSGIGPRKHLTKHNIRTISNLPVGKGLQNQVGVFLAYNMTKQIVPYIPLSPYDFPAASVTGYVALNRTNYYPDYQLNSFIMYPSAFLAFCSYTFFYKDSICNNLSETSVNSHLIFGMVNKVKSKSRGKVLLKSNDYRDDPLIFTKYYSHNEDLEHHARCILDYIKVEESKTFKKLGGQIKDPKLPQCGEMDKTNIEYWKCYIQYMVISQYKYSSTCAMGAVVDSRLRVYGVKRLRVVDASVLPYSPVGGTLGPTIMIGEKAADMIKEDKYKWN